LGVIKEEFLDIESCIVDIEKIATLIDNSIIEFNKETYDCM